MNIFPYNRTENNAHVVKKVTVKRSGCKIIIYDSGKKKQKQKTKINIILS